jgi:hypothetical protein
MRSNSLAAHPGKGARTPSHGLETRHCCAITGRHAGTRPAVVRATLSAPRVRRRIGPSDQAFSHLALLDAAARIILAERIGDMSRPRNVLIVAHQSVATPTLVDEVRSRCDAGPCRLALLIPDASDPEVAAWTLRRARRMLSKSVGVPVDGIVAEGDDPFDGIVAALREGEYDEILLSTLPEGGSRWLRDELPARVRALGVNVTVVTAAPVAS